jgi:hypothetical protein
MEIYSIPEPVPGAQWGYIASEEGYHEFWIRRDENGGLLFWNLMT